ncbi:MAG: hypothetical protein KJP25_09780 [Gammaproteobacteria bacterium]|nr:hypothetical protein [Gammaproteobacteria bacterium]MBT8150160.1 hypothetical protein [Gammaproteobacteria bacterium]NNL10619.1 hypothetical protein [Pseudomonadales bacterium]NNM10305.1 hypothetical protein [Pseudomonadales bacterium]RZV54518.1 MAG: hypothetical protein EX270_07475 [Pseudomonadales bacterium]
MKENIYLRVALKAFLFWLLFSLAGFFWGDKLVSALLPFYEWTVEQVNPNYQADIRIEKENQAEPKIILAATALRNIPIVPDKELAAGKTIESSVTVLHTLVPLVILLTVLCVFPLRNLRQRALLLLLGIPAVFAVSALTAPLQLLGNLEIGFMNAAQKFGYSKETPWVLDWMILTEGGGRWLIPILIGLLCGVIVHHFSPQESPDTEAVAR